MAVFEYTMDDAFVGELFDHNKRISKVHRARNIIRLAVGVFIIAAFAIQYLQSGSFGMLGLLPLFVLALLIARIEKPLTLRRFEKSPLYNVRFHVQLTSEDVTTKSDKSDVRLAWSAFTSAHQFDDGMLLRQGPQASQWLPYRLLTEGTKDDVQKVVRANVADYKIV